jgi:hypothetical protein
MFPGQRDNGSLPPRACSAGNSNSSVFRLSVFLRNGAVHAPLDASSWLAANVTEGGVKRRVLRHLVPGSVAFFALATSLASQTVQVSPMGWAVHTSSWDANWQVDYWKLAAKKSGAGWIRDSSLDRLRIHAGSSSASICVSSSHGARSSRARTRLDLRGVCRSADRHRAGRQGRLPLQLRRHASPPMLLATLANRGRHVIRRGPRRLDPAELDLARRLRARTSTRASTRASEVFDA